MELRNGRIALNLVAIAYNKEIMDRSQERDLVKKASLS